MILPPGVVNWLIVVPAIVGAVLGFGFRWLHHGLHALSERVPSRVLQIIVGTLLFAALATALPLVRFSGHHEIAELTDLVADGHPGALMMLAVAKILGLGICLTSG